MNGRIIALLTGSHLMFGRLSDRLAQLIAAVLTHGLSLPIQQITLPIFLEYGAERPAVAVKVRELRVPGDRVQADFDDLGTVEICFEEFTR